MSRSSQTLTTKHLTSALALAKHLHYPYEQIRRIVQQGIDEGTIRDLRTPPGIGDYILADGHIKTISDHILRRNSTNPLQSILVKKEEPPHMDMPPPSDPTPTHEQTAAAAPTPPGPWDHPSGNTILLRDVRETDLLHPPVSTTHLYGLVSKGKLPDRRNAQNLRYFYESDLEHFQAKRLPPGHHLRKRMQEARLEASSHPQLTPTPPAVVPAPQAKAVAFSIATLEEQADPRALEHAKRDMRLLEFLYTKCSVLSIQAHEEIDYHVQIQAQQNAEALLFTPEELGIALTPSIHWWEVWMKTTEHPQSSGNYQVILSGETFHIKDIISDKD